MADGVYLSIDASELNGELQRLKAVLTPEQFDRVMVRIFRRTGGHVRQVLKTDIPKQYHAKAGEIGEAVKNARVIRSGLGVGCTIPVIGPRKSIGGGFNASGGAHGWASLRRKYRVKARIVKSGQSVLPPNMDDYGGKPPFRNLGSKLGKLTFTRLGRERLPIRKVSGIGIPQMPMNRSQEDVQRDIVDYMRKRMEHEFQYMIAGK